MRVQERRPFLRGRNISAVAVGIVFLVGLFFLQHSALSVGIENLTIQFLHTEADITNILSAPFRGLSLLARNKSQLLGENQRLQAENRALQEELLTLKLAGGESQMTKSAMQISGLYPRVTIVHVIGFSPTRPKEMIWLDQGQTAGVEIGDLVVLPEKTLVGRIIKVLPQAALAETIFNGNVKIASRVGDAKNEGLFVGGEQPEVTLILRGATIRIGDAVVSSGEDGNFPRGFLLGAIQDITSQPADPSQEATVEVPFTLTNIDVVLILKNPLH